VLGNYNQYLAKVKPQLSKLDIDIKIQNPLKIAKKEKKLKEAELKKIEKEIAVLENKIKLVEDEFTQPDFYTKNPNGYGKRISHLSDLKRQLDKLMAKWEALS
jgi:ATP-binding cassette subfamily F protein uup